jgi:pimeloyl-ACP methyl ester carboxylesterase
MTRAGLEEFQGEPDRLRRRADEEIGQRLREACSYGDGSNNDEYHAVREEPMRATSILARQAQSVVRSLFSGNTALDRPRPTMPPGYIAEVPGAGDLFYRDTGEPEAGSRGTVLLLHGWMVPSDPHWLRTYSLLHEQGYRVIALDARGHGHGLRAQRFELTDCASDAAALVRYLGCGPVVCVGYSMGGLIAQLMAKRHPQELAGAVLAATTSEMRDSLILQLVWSGMGVFQWWLKLAPRWTWNLAVNAVVQGDEETTAWAVGELRRGAAEDIAEAGREIGRFDSRPWLEDVRQPMVVLVTTIDVLVPSGRQRELARRLEAPVVELHSDHLAPATTPGRFGRSLCQALDLLERMREREEPRLGSVG